MFDIADIYGDRRGVRTFWTLTIEFGPTVSQKEGRPIKKSNFIQPGEDFSVI
jgi:hypothetical protein